jgi:rod shape-determining protein MreC
MGLGDRTGTRLDTTLFVACLLISLVALALPEALREPLAGAMRRSVLFPLLTVQRQSVRSATYRQDIDALRAQRDSLSLRATEVGELLAENARLRGLLALGARLRTGFIQAEVLHQAGVSDGISLVLSAGRDRGVEVLAPVVSPDGLVGLVRTVDGTTSVAMAWTHPEFRASAVVEGAGIFGIVAARHGEATGEVMELRGIPYRDEIEPGTKVVTSGLGGIFPRGIPLGTVEGVLSESAGWERTYLLRPAVHPADAGQVLVLSRSRAGDALAPAFAPGPDSGAAARR